jgi:hypothetical protein
MSIATLKRKTQSKYNNSSVGGPHFSLHGTHRNQGYIGQTSLSRSLPRTLAGGAYNKGHGGCCGTYTDLESPVVSAVSSTEDSRVVKSAVLSSKGMMAKRLRCCEPTVKPDNSTSLNSQSSYLEYLKNKCAKIESEVMPELQKESYVDDVFAGLNFPDLYENVTFDGNNVINPVLFGDSDPLSFVYYLEQFRKAYFLTYGNPDGTGDDPVKTGFNVTSAPRDFQKGLYTFTNDAPAPSNNNLGIIHNRHGYLVATKYDIAEANNGNTGDFYYTVDVPGFITITLPYKLKISSSQLFTQWAGYMPDEYKIYGIENGIEYELLHVNHVDWDAHWNNIGGTDNGLIENIQSVSTEKSFNSFKFHLIYNDPAGNGNINTRIRYWKLGGIAYYNTCTKCNLTKTDADINVAISQEEHLKNVKGKVLNCEDMAPEFHRKSNTCTTGRGACGSD